MAVRLMFFDSLHIDLTILFYFWAGASLIRHSPTVRKWVIGFSGLMVFASLALALWAVAVGTEGMTVTIGRTIDNPPVGYVIGVAIILTIVAGVPFVLLLTSQAREEFARDK